jgi:hypothetical protein
MIYTNSSPGPVTTRALFVFAITTPKLLYLKMKKNLLLNESMQIRMTKSQMKCQKCLGVHWTEWKGSGDDRRNLIRPILTWPRNVTSANRRNTNRDKGRLTGRRSKNYVTIKQRSGHK